MKLRLQRIYDVYGLLGAVHNWCPLIVIVLYLLSKVSIAYRCFFMRLSQVPALYILTAKYFKRRKGAIHLSLVKDGWWVQWLSIDMRVRVIKIPRVEGRGVEGAGNFITVSFWCFWYSV